MPGTVLQQGWTLLHTAVQAEIIPVLGLWISSRFVPQMQVHTVSTILGHIGGQPKLLFQVRASFPGPEGKRRNYPSL